MLVLRYGLRLRQVFPIKLQETGFALQRRPAAALDRITGLGISLALLSLGEHGVLARYEGQTYRVVAPEVAVVNPIGSGDSLVAGLAMGLTDDLDIEATLRLGVAAGAANAAIWPAAGITREQVQRLLPQVQVLRQPG